MDSTNAIMNNMPVSNTQSSPQMLAYAKALLSKASRMGADRPEVSIEGYARCRSLQIGLLCGEIDPDDCQALEGVLEVVLQFIDPRLICFSRPNPSREEPLLSFLFSCCDNRPIAFSRPILEKGVHFIGGTGCGKSTILLWLLNLWNSLDLPAIVFTRKQDQFFWQIAQTFYDRTLILRAGIDVFYNAFLSVTGDFMDLVGGKLQYFVSTYNRYDSKLLLTEVLKRLHDRGVKAGIQQIIAILKDTSLPKSIFNQSLKASLLNVLTDLSYGPLGVSMNTGGMVEFQKLLKGRGVIILDCALLNNADFHFLVSCILSDIRKILVMCPETPAPMCIIDEAGEIITNAWDDGKHSSALASEVIYLRGAGIPLVMGYHSFADISSRIRANSGITIIGPLGHGADIVAAATAASLDEEQKRCISRLEPCGQAILKIVGQEPSLVWWPEYRM